MNVTILTTSFPEHRGDLAGVFVEHLARALRRQNVQVRVVAPYSSHSLREECLDGVRVNRFQYFYPARWQRVSYGYGIPANMKASLLAKLGLLPFLIAFYLAALQWRKSTDVYHAQWIISGLVAVLGAPLHRKPVVLTVRGSDLNLAKGKVLSAIVRFVFERVTAITTVSEALREKVLTLGISPDKVSVMPNGVDCQIFHPRPKEKTRKALDIPSDRPVILWIGRLVEIKGVKFLVEAIPEVLSRVPSALFVLVGNGNLEKSLKQQARQFGVTHAIRFTGKVSTEAIPLWLNAADVLTLPSLNEGRPNVILESMACRLPVVATEVGGIPELVRHGCNGFLVPPREPSFLAQYLITLLTDDELRLTMGTIGQNMLFEMGLSWDQCATRLREMYTKVNVEHA